MASVSQWEVVGKPKKNKNSPSSKTQKKQHHPKMITIEPNAPLKEDKTMFTAFLEKEEREQQKLLKMNAASARNGHAPSNNSNNKKPTAPKKKKPENEVKKVEKVSIDVAISQISVGEVESVLKQTQLKFPENPDVWLKDLASFLNLKLENAAETGPFYRNKPIGYPLVMLPQSSQKTLNSVVKKFSNQTLDNLFYHCIQQMLQASAKDQCSLGHKIFLQLLAQHKPDITVSKKHQYLELLRTHQNRPALCTSILWAVGQCGNKNLKAGLKVWLDLMLPMLEVRQVAVYPVEYLEMLLGTHSGSQGFEVLSLSEYFTVLDIVFNPRFNLAVDLRNRLTALYPRVKELAFGDSPSHTLRTFFGPYLARFSVGANPGMKAELLSSLVQCLATDKQSFSVWCQLYTKHLVASGHLLEYMSQEWTTLSSRLDVKLLHDTLRSFAVTNDEMELLGKAGRDGLPLCQAATKDLLLRMQRGSFPWGVVVFCLVSLLASIVIYDVASSPHWKKSRTMSFLQHYGICCMVNQAAGRIQTFLAVVAEWMGTHCPEYLQQARDAALPWMVLAWETTRDLAFTAEEVTRGHRAWAVDAAVRGYHWMYELSPETWMWCRDASLLAWEATLEWSAYLWQASGQLAGRADRWLTDNVLTGAMSKDSLRATAEWTVSQMHNYTTQAWANIVTMVK